MSRGNGKQIQLSDLESRIDALSQRVKSLEDERDYLAQRLADAEEERDEIRRRLAAVEDDTDLLRLNEKADEVDAEQRRAAILQHMWRAVRDKPDGEQMYAMDTTKVNEILHYPDVDRTTIIRWMRTTPRLVENEKVCWYDGGDSGPSGKPARIYLDVRQAGETLLENVKRRSRQPNNPE